MPFDTYVISGSTPSEQTDCPALVEDAEAVIRQRAPALGQEFDARGWQLPKSIDRVYDSPYAQKAINFHPYFI